MSSQPVRETTDNHMAAGIPEGTYIYPDFEVEVDGTWHPGDPRLGGIAPTAGAAT